MWAVAQAMVAAERPTFNATCANPHTGRAFNLSYTPTVELIAAGISDDKYLSNADYAAELAQVFGASADGVAYDEETAAFMHACASSAAPCLAIRGLPNDINDLSSADCANLAFPALRTTVSLFMKHWLAAQRGGKQA